MIDDLKERFLRLRQWDWQHRLIADEPEAAPDGAAPLRAPSIEAVETEIARCRSLVDRMSAELVETHAILDGAQRLARTLGAMLDDARLAAAESQ